MTGALCTLPRCGRPVADGAYACGTCTAELRTVLGEIISLSPELDNVLTRQARRDPLPAVSGTHRSPMPVDWSASIDTGTVENTLTTWIRHVCEQAPDTYVWLPGIPWYAGWLVDRLEWLRHRPEVVQAADELAHVERVMRAAVDGPGERQYAGPCDDCNTDLYAVPGASEVACRACAAHGVETVYDLADRRAWLLDLADDQLLYAHEMAAALTSLDEPLTAAQIRGWAFRGRLVPHGTDSHGRPVYSVREVRDILAGLRARKRAG